MQYVQKYMELYPEDTVVVKGGAAAYLIIKDCLGQNVPLNDIDVSINTTESERTILSRWVSIVPSSYQQVGYASTIFTLVDTTCHDLAFDIFVNEDYFSNTEKVGFYQVERLDLMIFNIFRELKSRKSDMDFIQNPMECWSQNPMECWSQKDISDYIEKYNRISNRLVLLVECLKKRQGKCIKKRQGKYIKKQEGSIPISI